MRRIEILGRSIQVPNWGLVVMALGLAYAIGFALRVIVGALLAAAVLKALDKVDEVITGESEEEDDDSDDDGDDDGDQEGTGYTDPNGQGDWDKLWDIGSRQPAPALGTPRTGLPTRRAPETLRDTDRSSSVGLGFASVLDPMGTPRPTKRNGSASYPSHMTTNAK